LTVRPAELFTTRIDSYASRKQLGQTKTGFLKINFIKCVIVVPTSVREDVNAHISSQGVVAEDPGGGLQGGMPCQAAPLQQRHCFIVNDPHHLQMPFHLYKCLTQTRTIIAGNWLQAALNLLYAQQARKAWDQLGITSSFTQKYATVPSFFGCREAFSTT